MKSKKIKVISIIVVVVVLLVVIIIALIKNKKKIYNNYVQNLQYDVRITGVSNKPIEPTGYASESTYYLVNYGRKIVYIVNDYYVFGSSEDDPNYGSNYTVTKKSIDDEMVETIKQIYNKESVERSNANYKFEYKDKEVFVEDFTFYFK